MTLVNLPVYDAMALNATDAGSVATRFGQVQVAGSSAETVWSKGGLYPWSTFDAGAQSLELVSSSANDAAAGTGARQLTLLMIDSSWNFVNVTVVPNGTTPVAISGGPFRRARRGRVILAGSANGNVGTLTVRVAGGGTTVMEIPASNNYTSQCIETVPAGYTGLLKRFICSTSKLAAASPMVTIFVRNFGEVFVEQATVPLDSVDNMGSSPRDFLGGIKIPEKSDVDIRVRNGAANAYVNAEFDIAFFKGVF